jgi:hypothetical protein
MSVATSAALAIGLGVAGVAGAAGSAIAGSEQAGAAESAQQLQADEANQALQFQEKEWNQDQANEAPFIQAGQGAVGQLSSLLSQPGKGLLASYPGGPFTAPTLQQAEQYPGYQFQLQQGEEAIQNQASAAGEALDPNAARAEAGYAENLAQNDYGNVYNQALQTYENNFNVWNTDQTNEYNRIAGLAGAGEQATATLGAQGQQAAGNTGNILLTSGAQQGQDIQNAAAAEASGFVGGANAIGGAASGLGTTLALQQMLQQNSGLLNPNGSVSPYGQSIFNAVS